MPTSKKYNVLNKAFLCLFPVLLLCCEANSITVQYENYEWGISKGKATYLVQNNGYKISKNTSFDRDDQEAIYYEDELFSEKIIVGLIFTPVSKKLYRVLIKSKDRTVGKDLKSILIEKYGQPSKASDYKYSYMWMKDKKTVLLLEYELETIVAYSSIKYSKVHEKEKQKLHKDETKDKF